VTDLNPEQKMMADESMVRTLASQAVAIWPQERELIRRYELPDAPRILDAGCGTGEIASRLADMFPRANVLGVDILDHHLEMARQRYARLGARIAFEHRSVYELGLPDGSFDLTVCRHVVHSVPHAEKVIAELVRVTKKGGWLHLLPEDYGMLHFQRRSPNPGDFWHLVPPIYGAAANIDLYIGRNSPPILESLGLKDVRADYVVVDTLRVPRETFAKIIEAWRDGYVDVVAERAPLSSAEVRGYFESMIANIRDPRGYAMWLVPIVSGRVV
jgi:ubiquinone/menaquinone biosynthesis C-methylase UbiE